MRIPSIGARISSASTGIPPSDTTLYFRYLHDDYNTIDPFSTFAASPLPTDPTLRTGRVMARSWLDPRHHSHMINEARTMLPLTASVTMYGDTWQRSHMVSSSR